MDRPSRLDTLSAGERVSTTAVAKPRRRPTPAAPAFPFWLSVEHLSCTPIFSEPVWHHTLGHTRTATRSRKGSQIQGIRWTPEYFGVHPWTYDTRYGLWPTEACLAQQVNQAEPSSWRTFARLVEPWAGLGRPNGPLPLWAQLQPTKPADS
jgi:hypothetical protein